MKTLVKSRNAQTLADTIDRMTVEGELYEKLPGGKVRCFACGHRCLILEDTRGICQVRYNRGGTLLVPYGYVGALQCDPTEKKPFFHVLPGSKTLTFGMLGCDYHCPYCQNWVTSQALRDDVAGAPPLQITPQKMVALAQQYGAQLVGSSYNEPLITAEWAAAIFRESAKAGLRGVFISNGNATPEALDFIRPHLVAYKVDLKTMSADGYRQLGGVLDNVLRTIKMVHERGLWVEVVTLVIPTFNDSDELLTHAAEFIAAVSPDIPWHVTAFHKDYKMTDPDNTPPETLLRAAEIGRKAGLRFVYAGNLPGETQGLENTYCPNCRELLVERFGYHIRKNALAGSGACPKCHTPIPGLWA